VDEAKAVLGDSPAEKRQAEEEQAAVIRLVRDDVPITGRIVDAKGQPVTATAIGICIIIMSCETKSYANFSAREVSLT
jgi:hypothetical protein